MARLVEPLLPRFEPGDLVFELIVSVLLEHRVECSFRSFGVTVRKSLIAIQDDPRLRIVSMKGDEVPRIVRQ